MLFAMFQTNPSDFNDATHLFAKVAQYNIEKQKLDPQIACVIKMNFGL